MDSNGIKSSSKKNMKFIYLPIQKKGVIFFVALTTMIIQLKGTADTL